MLDIRPILFVVGVLLAILASFMFLPALVDAATGSGDWRVFLTSAFFTLFIGVTLALGTRTGPLSLSVRQTFLLTTLSWTVMAAFAALPFVFADLGLDFTDAYFESISGLTTTGSTVMSGLDAMPRGILLWRALLQWQGGIGIIVMAIAVLPMLRIGGMQLFRTESSDKSEKVLPRVAQTAAAIGVVYVGMTAAAAVSYWATGMSVFDAVVHAMTTIPTGGYSNYDASVGHFNNPYTEWAVSFFMLLAGAPVILYFQLVRGHWRDFFCDTQVQTYFGIGIGVTAAMTAWLWFSLDMRDMASVRHAVFNLISMITGTGYAATDFVAWGPFPMVVLLFVMLIGGCTGSTAGGIKVFRVQVLVSVAAVQIRRLLQPHAVFVPRFNRKPLSTSAASAVTSFLFLVMASFAAITLALALLGLDFMSAVSGAATAIANVGPGLSELIGPAGNFSSLPAAAKWVLSAAMLLGRLEFFTVLVLFTPRFWRG